MYESNSRAVESRIELAKEAKNLLLPSKILIVEKQNSIHTQEVL